MPPLIPNRFLVRINHTCPQIASMPGDDPEGPLVPLPESARLQNHAALDGGTNFADMRLGWNELGLGVWCEVRGKQSDPSGDADRPRLSDGLTLGIDTRDVRTSHRASRFCHQFHFLPTGGGSDKDEPAFVPAKINRALQDAPLPSPADVPFRVTSLSDGYRIEAFIPAGALQGFDPEQFPRLGIYYHVHDQELGDQYLSVNGDFPVAEDPTLWEPLDLTK